MTADHLGALRVGPAVLASGADGGALAGCTLVVKDVIDVAGQQTGAGNPTFLEDAAVATEHADAVTRLLDAGATVIGKAQTDELAFSLSGSNAHYGTPHNTAAPGRVPGGSSSGPAAAVAGGLADIGVGTDTAGSIRIPASYCGIAGFRPTYGRVPVHGVVALAPSFDTVGLLALGGDRLAAAGAALLGSPVGRTTPSVSHLVIADDLMAEADTEVASAVEIAAGQLGDVLQTRPLHAICCGGRLAAWLNGFRFHQLVEVWAVHGHWIKTRAPVFGPGVASRFDAARAAAGAERDVPPLGVLRDEVRRAIAEVLPPGGALVIPAAATVAPCPDLPLAAKEDLRTRTLRLTCVASLGGLPALSLPLSRIGGLPVGICLVGRPGEDETLLATAAQVYGDQPWPAPSSPLPGDRP